MFRKKFKVRVTLYTDGAWIIEYAHYRIFKVWFELHEFEGYDCSILDDYEPMIFLEFDHAVQVARSFKTYADIEKHYAEEEKKAERWYKKREDRLAKQTKVFEIDQ